MFKVVYGFLVGIPFGMTFDKALVSHPAAVQGQMVFEINILLKMFLSAAASSLLACTLVYFTSPTTFAAVRQGHATIKAKEAVMVGAAILGMGMTVAGACPGMVLSQVGSQVPGALFVFLGGLLGAATHSFFEPQFNYQLDEKQTFFDQKIITSYWKITLPIAAACIACVAVCESIFPWDTEARLLLPDNLQKTMGFEYGISASCWPPYICGAFFGVFQLLLQFGPIQRPLGSSSAYVCAVSSVIPAHPKRLDLKFGGWDRKAWQVAFIFGAVAGGFLSSSASGTQGVATSLPSVLQGIFGGFLMVFGSRVAAGCTSGHGISGFSILAYQSLLAVPAMFGGGIALAVLLRSMGYPLGLALLNTRVSY